jgi:hypothetical protein
MSGMAGLALTNSTNSWHHATGSAPWLTRSVEG